MRIRILDPLRGLAALSVVLFHFSGYLLPSILPNALSVPFGFGKFGVQVFFVISGFVIPYSMDRGGYTLRSFPVFMTKRVIRICPPAYIASALMIGFHFFQRWMGGPQVDIPWDGFGLRSIVGNLTFTAGHLHTFYYDFVHWTLAIEFQFYVIIGLLLPLLLDRVKWIRTALILVAISAMGFVGAGSFFENGGSFVFGLAVFLFRRGSLPLKPFVAVLLLTCAMMAMQRDLVWLAFSLTTTLIILSGFEFDHAATNWLGKVSYSLYIVHPPAGLFAECIMKNFTHIHDTPAGKLLLLFFYIAIALAAAGIFHHWVERPCMELAKRAGAAIERRRKEKVQVSTVPQA